jgi:hypothetical protein
MIIFKGFENYPFFMIFEKQKTMPSNILFLDIKMKKVTKYKIKLIHS